MSVIRWLIAVCALFVMTSTGFASEVLRDVEYARPAGVGLTLDASIPDGAGPFPAAIIVHGGGWVRGDKRTDVAPLFKPLSDANIAWFSIDYRLASDPLQFGLAIDDVEAAIGFVKAHAAEYRIDADRLALIGESAGGQLAAMAAFTTPVKAVVAIYTPTDLVSLLRTSELIPPQVRNSLKGTPLEGLLLARLAQLSPIEQVRREMPPFLMIHGTADPLVPFEQSKAMCVKMQAAGASCDLFRVPGGGHGIRGWEWNPAIAEPYKKEMVRWLKQQLGAKAVVVL